MKIIDSHVTYDSCPDGVADFIAYVLCIEMDILGLSRHANLHRFVGLTDDQVAVKYHNRAMPGHGPVQQAGGPLLCATRSCRCPRVFISGLQVGKGSEPSLTRGRRDVTTRPQQWTRASCDRLFILLRAQKTLIQPRQRAGAAADCPGCPRFRQREEDSVPVNVMSCGESALARASGLDSTQCRSRCVMRRARQWEPQTRAEVA